jgi:hypothetical protein
MFAGSVPSRLSDVYFAQSHEAARIHFHEL